MSSLANYGIKLDANAIHKKDFSKKMRGYDPVEVDEYLDEIIKDYAAMQEIISRFEADLADIHRQIELGGEAFDAYMIRRRLEDLEMRVFGEKRERLKPRV